MLSWCQKHGWQHTGFRGSGHVEVTHTSGAVGVISSTPSDSGTRQNEKSMLLRLVGGHEEKPRAAKYRHRSTTGGWMATRANPSTDDSPWRVAERAIREVDEQLMDCDPRTARARELASKRLDLARQLESFHQPVPPIPKVF